MLEKIKNKIFNKIKRSIANRNMLKSFAKKNLSFWKDIGQGKNKISGIRNKIVLVEISEKNPFELESNMRVAKAIEHNSGLHIVALVSCIFKSREPYVKLAQSYSISSVFSLYSLSFANIIRLVASFIEGYNLYRNVNSLNDIEVISYKGVLIGDLIYDTYIRMLDGKYSPEKDIHLFKFLVTAIFNQKIICDVFDKNDVEFLIVADKCYLNHGVLYRVAIGRGIKVLMPTKELKYLHADNITTHFYHPEIALIDMAKELKGVDIEKEVTTYFQKRFSGDINQIDVLTSYRNKRIYSADELRVLMDLDISKKNIVIMPHAFSDFPHIADGLYTDYYIWLVELLNVVKKIHNVNWLIKPHPTSYIFNETGVVETLLADLGASNVKVVPNDMNTASVKDIADVILTVRGTPGLEFATFGIPVVTAGKGCYSGYGLDVEPTSKQNYINIINNLNDVGTLSDQQVKDAKMIFYYLFIKQNAKLNYLMDDIENNMGDYNRILVNILKNNESDLFYENVLYKATLKMLKRFN
jgi:hypothetical protein